jgi:hypothetical protein
MAQGYCVKEKKKVEIKDPSRSSSRTARDAVQAPALDCGTKIFKMGKL